MKMNGETSKISTFLMLLLIVLSLGCGGASNPTQSGTPGIPAPTATSVSISPATAYVEVGYVAQFTAQGQNDPRGVSWSIAGCSGVCGTIDSTGKYSAATNPTALQVVATSVSDPTKSARAAVYVTPTPVGIAVSPAVVTVPSGGAQLFNATGTPLPAVSVVTWTVSGSGCAGGACGTIDSNGMYQAPATIPSPPSVVVSATSATDPSISGSAVVTLGSDSNNAELNGQYAFLVAGYDGDGNVAMAGSFVADGNGNISSGITDQNFSSSGFVATNLTFTGTYSVGSDNRASLTLLARGATVFTSGFSETFSFALNSFAAGVAGRGRMIELDNEQQWTTGILAKQDPTAFTTAAVNGGYAFGFAGTGQTGWPLTANGRFTANGGSLTAGQSDVYGLGLTESGGGSVEPALNLPFTGSYEVSANGRGTAVLNFSTQPGFSNFSFYVVSASELLFIETDACVGSGKCTEKAGISGAALQQSGGPFSTSSLEGTTVLNLTGAGVSTANGGSVAVGLESFDGAGGLVGTRSENNAGVITIGTEFDGNYTVDANGLGRGLITVSGDPEPKPFYLVSPGKGFIIDSNSYEAGEFASQTGGPFANQSISGDYTLGTLPWVFNWAFSPSCAVMTSDGSGGLRGVSDGHDGTDQSFAGTYNVTSNGEATMVITPQIGTSTNWIFYMVSPSKALGIDVDAGSANIAIAIIEK